MDNKWIKENAKRFNMTEQQFLAAIMLGKLVL